MTTPRMMAAIMTKTTPEKRTVREIFFFRLRLMDQRSCLGLTTLAMGKYLRDIETYRQWDGDQVQIREDIRDQDREHVEFGIGWLADARIGVDLPVSRHGSTPEKEEADDDDERPADEGVCDVDADLQVRQFGPVS